jgi:glutathione synthase/RimK-type ligase-like ATP-grasp enzyme
MDVALVTCSQKPHLSHSDSLLQKALVARNIDAHPLPWDDPEVDWSRPLVSVIRSTGDHYLRRAAFLEWAQRVSRLHTLWNPLPLLRWNTHKSYLYDLKEHGVPIIPTFSFAQGSSVNLAQLMEAHGWPEVVIKPAVSANAYGTILVEGRDTEEGQLYLDHMLSIHDMLIQPYIPTAMSNGERSLTFIDGKITHAVLSPPGLRHNGIMKSDLPKKELIVPQEEELRLAYKIIDTLHSPVLYARIDLVHDVDGQLRVMEIELVEQGLSLDWAPEAVERFADAIEREVWRARSKRA